MKIINKEQFLKLPEGILFNEFKPLYFNYLNVKGETWDKDYIEMDLIGNIEADSSTEWADKVEDALESGQSLKLDFDSWGRNGMFDKDQLYAVYEQEDIDALIQFLKGCKGI